MAKRQDISIQQGRTFKLTLRWEIPPIIYKAITAMMQAAPLRITVPGHGAPDGWRVAISGAKGMTEINAEPNAVRESDYHQATVIDPNTIELNDVNASSFRSYTSGGYLQYNTPAPLDGFSARMSIKDKIGGTELLVLTTENNRIVLDTTKHTITLILSATDTAAINWRNAIYDLELASGDSPAVVTALLTGRVSVSQEVTT